METVSDPFLIYAQAEKLLPPVTDNKKYEKINRALSRRIKKGDLAARNEIVVRNYRLVRKILHQIIKDQYYNIDDLVQAGMLGLLKAAERFNPKRGVGFVTFATWWIWSNIKAEKKNWRVIHLPNNALDKLGFLLEYKASFWNEHHRDPTDLEMARALARQEYVSGNKCEPAEENILRALPRCLDVIRVLFDVNSSGEKLSSHARARKNEAANVRDNPKISYREQMDPFDHLVACEELRRYEQMAERIRNASASWKPIEQFVLTKRILAPADEQLTLQAVRKLMIKQPDICRRLSRQRISQIEEKVTSRLEKLCRMSKDQVRDLSRVIEDLAVLANV